MIPMLADSSSSSRNAFSNEPVNDVQIVEIYAEKRSQDGQVPTHHLLRVLVQYLVLHPTKHQPDLLYFYIQMYCVLLMLHVSADGHHRRWCTQSGARRHSQRRSTHPRGTTSLKHPPPDDNSRLTFSSHNNTRITYHLSTTILQIIRLIILHTNVLHITTACFGRRPPPPPVHSAQ